MADKPVGEVVAVDAVLDGLSSPTSSDVYEALEPFSNDAVGAVAAKRALGGGGGGITEITSNDESVTITNPNGPTVDLSANGGSGPTIYTGDGPINPTGTLVELAEETPSTSGTFTLTFRGETTDPIAFDAVSDDIVNAFGALAAVSYQVAVEDGYSGYALNESPTRFHYTGALQGTTEAPTVTNDLTDNGVAVTLDFPGDSGDPELPAMFAMYVVAGEPPLLYVFDGSTWAVTSVANLAITTAKLAAGAVTAAKIASAAVGTGQLANAAVVNATIADGAVTSAKITPPLSYRDPLTTTVSQLITEMIAGNLMEPS